MNPEEAAAKAQAILDSYDWDPEATHSELDGLLCEIAEQHGYSRLVEIFTESERWYS